MTITSALMESKGFEEIPDYQLEKRYCEMLDEVYGTAKIAGYEYETSRALAEVDPTAFRCGLADWISSELGETIEEIDGKYYDIGDYTNLANELEDENHGS